MALYNAINMATPAEGPSILPPPTIFTWASKLERSSPVIFLNTEAALKTESLAILPAVSLNLMAPFPLTLAGKATASISITEPRNPCTPSPKILPTSDNSEALPTTFGVSRPDCITSYTFSGSIFMSFV